MAKVGRCGNDHTAIPVLTHDTRIRVWVPAENRFGLRLLNHTLYCLWVTSLQSQLSVAMRKYAERIANYVQDLCRAFFDEVLRKWYGPGAKLGDGAQPSSHRGGFISPILTLFLLLMYERDTPTPYEDNGSPDGSRKKIPRSGVCALFQRFLAGCLTCRVSRLGAAAKTKQIEPAGVWIGTLRGHKGI